MNYINQAPKELKAQSAGFRKQHPTLMTVAQSGNYYIEPKYDGVHGVAILGETGGKMLSRDNKEYLSCDHILKDLHEVFGTGWVIFGEIYKFDTPFKEISGAARRHSAQPDLLFVVYDMVSLAGFERGFEPVAYEDRRQRIAAAWLNAHASGSMKLSLIKGAFHPAVSTDPDAFAGSLKKLGGYDGAMLKDTQAAWSPGACKDGEAIKVKPKITLDLRVVGMEEGEGKHKNTMGALLVEYRGVTSKVGTGFDDKERSMWWSLRHVQFRSSLNCYIVEVECMEVTSTNKLREPVYKGERHDKPQPD